MSAFTAADVRAALGTEVLGSPPALEGFSPLHTVRAGTVTWSRDPDPWAALPPCLVLGPPELAPPPDGSGAVRLDDPRLGFVLLAERFPPPPLTAAPVLGADVTLGEHVVLGAGVVVGEGARIDAGAVIEPGTVIGRRCHIQAGAVLGAAGYGYVGDAAGAHHRFPYLGRVRLEDDVNVGANTTIARGQLEDTEIYAGTLIDNLCHIGHNAKVGPRALLVARCVIGGSARIGEEAFVGMGALVSDSLSVGRRATVGMGAVVMQDVPEGATVMARAATQLPPSDQPARYRL